VRWPEGVSCDVVCIRHGQSEANVGGELVGRRDPPLTALGRRQAAAAGRYLAMVQEPPAVVVSSPLQRAMDTAGPAAAAMGAAIIVDERLVELDYGELEGRPFTELLGSWPPPWISDHSVACPGGESIGDLTERVLAAVVEHAADAAAQGAALVVVTHLGPIKSLVGAVTGAWTAAQERMSVGQGSLTRLRVSGGDARLVALNLVWGAS